MPGDAVELVHEAAQPAAARERVGVGPQAFGEVLAAEWCTRIGQQRQQRQAALQAHRLRAAADHDAGVGVQLQLHGGNGGWVSRHGSVLWRGTHGRRHAPRCR